MTKLEAGAAGRQRWSQRTLRLLPWLAFLALMVWGWRTWDLFRSVPSYGDVLEGLWAINWYSETLRLGQSPWESPLAFHPQGWKVITYAWGPANFILLLPLNWLGGPAFAYNVATLLTFAIAFAGMLRLSARFTSRLAATVAALLFCFWGLRWYNNVGQLNVALASALLPWMLWSLECAFASPRRASGWFILTGVIWAIGINSTLYFIWIGGIALVAWVVGRLGRKRADWRLFGPEVLLIPVVGLGLSLPFLIAYYRATTSAESYSFTIYDLNVLGASLNSFPIPSLSHPWLGGLARQLYHGPPESEVSLTNLGFVGTAMAIAGIWGSRRSRRWRPVLLLAVVGFLLALGLTLKWNDHPVQISLLRPLNELIWRVGYRVNSSFFFVEPPPPPAFAETAPLPALFLATFVPFFALARVLARYALLAGLAVFLLAGFGLDQVKRPWIRLLLAVLLIVEVVPPPTPGLAFPPPSHPAYDWLGRQSLGTDGIVEFHTDPDNHLVLSMGGQTIWAAQTHRQPAVGGASSIVPGHIAYLNRWLAEHPQPFPNPDFMTLLRSYRVKYVLLTMSGGSERQSLADARQNAELRFVQCFEPISHALINDNRVCVLEVLPSPAPNFNVMFRDGWSGTEEWGRWIDGMEARANWIAPERLPYRLHLQAFPFCVAGQQQQMFVEVNGTTVAEHRWTDCDSWMEEITVPADLVQIGSNDLVIRAAYGTRPAEVSGGENRDPRSLSIGFTELQFITSP